MHAYFDGYVNSSSTLKIFLEQYEMALRDKYENELAEELKSKYNSVKCNSGFYWERPLEKVLTRKIFKLIQNQL